MRLGMKVLLTILVVVFALIGIRIIKQKIDSANPRVKVDIEYLYNCSSIGYLEYDLSVEGELDELRISRDKKRIAYSVDYKKEDDSIQTVFSVIDIQRKSNVGIIDDVKFMADYVIHQSEDLECEQKLQNYVKDHFKSHPGVLGGIVRYKIASWVYSPDKKRIAFIVNGVDGHKSFYPNLFVAEYTGDNITRIDSSSDVFCEDIIWLSSNEIMYSKDSVLWKAILKK
ncbi:MAG: hypothetical protein P9M06_01985 [Candidatus Saelkia tenebricola]|nr:hypothetical protein [Candidatus Saelkia tenebricola]